MNTTELYAKPISVQMLPLSKYPYRLTEQISLQTSIVGYEVETNYIKLTALGRLTIKVGYSWDGATGVIDTIDFIFASLVHDALYQLMRLGFLPQSCRKLSDKVLVDISKANGMSYIRAKYVYLGVRLFGSRFAAKVQYV